MVCWYEIWQSWPCQPNYMKKAIKVSQYILVFCLCWGLTSQSTIFQSCRDGATASWVINQYFRGVKCLAQGHNTAAVGFEPPTSRHSTTEPPRSPILVLKYTVLEALWFVLRHDKTNKMTVHPGKTQISIKKPWVLSYPLSTQRRLWSDWADAQAELSICWAHCHFVGFVMSRLIYFFSGILRLLLSN